MLAPGRGDDSSRNPHVRGLNDEGISLPAPARVPQIPTDVGRDVRTPIQGNDARIVHHLHVDHDIPRGLQDLIVTVLAPPCHGYTSACAAQARIEILRPARQLGTPSGAVWPRGVGRLSGFPLGRERRDTPVGRIYDQRSAILKPSVTLLCQGSHGVELIEFIGQRQPPRDEEPQSTLETSMTRRDDSTMVSDFRSSHLRLDAPAPTRSYGRHVVSGRAVREHPGAAAVPLAGCGPGR